MAKTTRLRIPVSYEELNALRGLAQKNGMALSAYLRSFLQKHILESTYQDVDYKLNFEKRIEALFSKGADQLVKVLRTSEDLLARSGVYSCAAWEAVKRDLSYDERKKYIETAVRRLRSRFEDDLSQAVGASEPEKPGIQFGRKK